MTYIRKCGDFAKLLSDMMNGELTEAGRAS